MSPTRALPIAAAPIVAVALAAALLTACAPDAPKGVDKDQLDTAVGQAIGDPYSCLLIAEQPGGRVVYRFNTHLACDRKLPACDAAGVRTLNDLLKATVKDGRPRQLSCSSSPDNSRGVSWASGVLPGKGLAYAAMMEGNRAFPGLMMAERLDTAFAKVGLAPHR